MFSRHLLLNKRFTINRNGANYVKPILQVSTVIHGISVPFETFPSRYKLMRQRTFYVPVVAIFFKMILSRTSVSERMEQFETSA